MSNLEKVIKGLDCCSKADMCYMEVECHYPTFLDCPYHEEKKCVTVLVKDALKLLEKKERGKPVRIRTDDDIIWVCPECRHLIKNTFYYCPTCGKELDNAGTVGGRKSDHDIR